MDVCACVRNDAVARRQNRGSFGLFFRSTVAPFLFLVLGSIHRTPTQPHNHKERQSLLPWLTRRSLVLLFSVAHTNTHTHTHTHTHTTNKDFHSVPFSSWFIACRRCVVRRSNQAENKPTNRNHLNHIDIGDHHIDKGQRDGWLREQTERNETKRNEGKNDGHWTSQWKGCTATADVAVSFRQQIVPSQHVEVDVSFFPER